MLVKGRHGFLGKKNVFWVPATVMQHKPYTVLTEGEQPHSLCASTTRFTAYPNCLLKIMPTDHISVFGIQMQMKEKAVKRKMSTWTGCGHLLCQRLPLLLLLLVRQVLEPLGLKLKNLYPTANPWNVKEILLPI